ncbi:MAG: hypothetical protein A49_04340 [Methyloceanibacter sp.]|nr:MAG: hypothetical protein A49_04340 [Methyloceanibacter sp.]
MLYARHRHVRALRDQSDRRNQRDALDAVAHQKGRRKRMRCAAGIARKREPVESEPVRQRLDVAGRIRESIEMMRFGQSVPRTVRRDDANAFGARRLIGDGEHGPCTGRPV